MFRTTPYAPPTSVSQSTLAPPIESTPGHPAPAPRAANSRKMTPVFLVLSLMCGWLFVWYPLSESTRTGHVHFFIQGVLLGPLFLYIAIVGYFTDIGDQEIRQTDARGQRRLTAKGKKFVWGSVVVMVLATAAWYALLSALGFDI